MSNTNKFRGEDLEKASVQFEKQLDALSQRISYDFGKKELLRQAMTHSSYNNEPISNYERLEFLGDRVLGLVVSEWLFEANNSEREGKLTKRFAWLVGESHLVDVGRRMHLDEIVRIGPALQRDRLPPSIIADLVESLIGAIYRDRGTKAASKFICDHVWDNEVLGAVPLEASARNILQELCAKRRVTSLEYDCSSHGPDHKRVFTCKASVTIEDHYFEANGEGASDSSAKTKAAQKLLVQIREQLGIE